MTYDYCLSCGKPLFGKEKEIGWKEKCLIRMFSSPTLPNIVLDEKAITYIAKSHIKEGNALSGVQKKLSFGLSKNKGGHLSLIDYPTGYILKPQCDDPFFPESENLVMNLAEIAGIVTVPHGLVPVGDSLAYICKRIDRENNKKIPMEDFCQLSLRLTEDKYKGSYEAMKGVILKYSSNPRLDEVELFYRLLFCFLTLNSDMHLKNFSLWDNGNGYRLSPCYDLLPVNLVFPYDREETALSLNGKKKNLRLKDFLAFAENGTDKEVIERRVALNIIHKLLTLEERFIEEIEHSYLSDEYKRKFIFLMKERFDRLRG